MIKICIKNLEDLRDKIEIKNLLAIARGGLVIGTCLSHAFNLPIGIIFTKSYEEFISKDIQCSQIIGSLNFKIEHVLIIDDIADTGKTLQHVKELVPDSKILTLFYKKRSIIKPDYYLYTIPDDTWIQFSWEYTK